MKRFLFILLASGCMVGPNYETPEMAMPPKYTEERVEETFDIQDEDFFRWWACVFQDPLLDQLLEEAISGSFDYRIALARVDQARAQYWVQFTQILPEFDGDFQATRFRASQSVLSQRANASSSSSPPMAPTTPSISPIQNFFQFGFDAIWEIDLFGRLRRAARAAYALWEASEEDAEAAKIVVLSEVANRYALIRALQAKVDIQLQLIEMDRDFLEIARQRLEAGLGTEQEEQAAVATLESDEAAIQGLEISLRQTIYSLGILLGRAPETLLDIFHTVGPIPAAMGKVPAGLPAELLRRRPDIRSAERQLAAATEQIGVAVGELFPKLSLTGSSSSFAGNPLQGANFGWSSSRLNNLFSPESRVWGIGGLVTFPVFDFGKRQAGVNVQVALEQQAYYFYQKTVIGALQEVEQALTAYFHEERRLAALSREERAFKRSLDLVFDEYEAGLVDFTSVIVSRANWLAALNLLVDSQQALATDLIALYKALGGDWSC